jgi:hypothetical protein
MDKNYVKKLTCISGSFYIPLPKNIKDSLKIGDFVYVSSKGNKIIIEKVQVKKEGDVNKK